MCTLCFKRSMAVGITFDIAEGRCDVAEGLWGNKPAQSAGDDAARCCRSEAVLLVHPLISRHLRQQACTIQSARDDALQDIAAHGVADGEAEIRRADVVSPTGHIAPGNPLKAKHLVHRELALLGGEIVATSPGPRRGHGASKPLLSTS